MKESVIENFISDELKPELLNLLINNTPVAYIILDEEYRVQFINDNFLKLRKLDRDAVMGEVCYNISNGGEPCKHCTVYDSRESGKKEFTLRRDVLPDGSVRFIDDYAIPLKCRSSDDPLYTLEIMVNRTAEMLARESRAREYDEILAVLSSLLEAKDTYTATHSENVRKIAYNMASSMNFSDDEIFEISIAASLHDLGKVKVPDRIINKPGKLTNEEYEIIKGHPAASFEMIEDLSSFENIKNIVRHHHERYDGGGYPDGLAGDRIPIGAKIVAVADTYEAMTSTRSYRKALSHEYALGEIKRMSGTQFDPEIVEVFENLSIVCSDTPAMCKLESSEASSVNRVLIQQSVKNNLGVAEKEDIQSKVDKVDVNYLLQEIFDNTPCGYVLMDTDRNVIFASKYFLDFMGLEEKEVLGRKCYEAGCIPPFSCKPCSPCAIEKALKSGNSEYMRHEQKTRNGWKIFDLFEVPLTGPDGNAEHVIEIIIDRTDEVNLERLRNSDFEKLIGTLSKLPELKSLGTDEPHLAEKIYSLQRRLEELLKDRSPIV